MRYSLPGDFLEDSIFGLTDFIKGLHRSSVSWSKNADNIENAVPCIKDWPLRHRLEPIIRQTPKGCFIDRQLLARDPLKTCVSPKQRIILIGDAAHPTLTAGGQGAGQAIEDGAVLAITLELAGKKNVPLALCAAEKMRYVSNPGHVAGQLI